MKRSLLEKIQNDVVTNLKAGNREKVDKLRYMKGELERKEAKNKDDNFILTELNSLRKKMEETGSDPYLCEVISEYLPKELSAEEIETWLKENVDFTKLKTTNQAIGILKK